jgi:hypothetical protein
VHSTRLHFILLEWPAKLHVPVRPASLEFLKPSALKLTPVLHATAEFTCGKSQLEWSLMKGT